jgi:hypothetical protein
MARISYKSESERLAKELRVAKAELALLNAGGSVDSDDSEQDEIEWPCHLAKVAAGEFGTYNFYADWYTPKRTRNNQSPKPVMVLKATGPGLGDNLSYCWSFGMAKARAAVAGIEAIQSFLEMNAIES